MGELASAHYRFRATKKTYHVDIDPRVPGANVRGAHRIVTDCNIFLSALLQELQARLSGDTKVRAQRNVAVVREAHAELNTLMDSERQCVTYSGNWIVR